MDEHIKVYITNDENGSQLTFKSRVPVVNFKDYPFFKRLAVRLRYVFKSLFASEFDVHQRIDFKDGDVNGFLDYLNYSSNNTIPDLPDDWCLEDVSYKLVDRTFNDAYKYINVNYVKQDDGRYQAVLSFLNDKGSKVNVEFNPKAVKDIGRFIESFEHIMN